MTELLIEAVRGSLVESVHRVSAVVVDAGGHRLAASGDPELVTFWRSAAKPFQAMPVVADGAADRFGLSAEDLALICASHSSEPVHLDAIDRLLARIGCSESDLGCGGHPPLSEDVARAVVSEGVELTPRWSNCSGNHAGMLALAKHHGWDTEGYYGSGHPVQDRLLAEIAEWTDLPVSNIVLGVDGCTTVCYGLPLAAMALAYARFGSSQTPSAQRIRQAMTEHPIIVGGRKRPCSDIMRAAGGTVVVKIGAEGVYGATVVDAGVGIALKVEDGGMRCAPIALLAIVRQLAAHGTVAGAFDQWLDEVEQHATGPISNTRGEPTGTLRPAGQLHFFA
ncbi:MAG: asparaginase [Gemmatimonadales bacterium]